MGVNEININSGLAWVLSLIIPVGISMLMISWNNRRQLDQNIGLRNFDKKQEVYLKIFSDIYKIQNLLKGIDNQFREVPRSRDRIEKLIEIIDRYQMDPTFYLYGNRSMRNAMEKWASAREDYLAAVSILFYESGLSDNDKRKFEEILVDKLKVASELFEKFGKIVRKDLGLN